METNIEIYVGIAWGNGLVVGAIVQKDGDNFTIEAIEKHRRIADLIENLKGCTGKVYVEPGDVLSIVKSHGLQTEESRVIQENWRSVELVIGELISDKKIKKLTAKVKTQIAQIDKVETATPTALAIIRAIYSPAYWSLYNPPIKEVSATEIWS